MSRPRDGHRKRGRPAKRTAGAAAPLPHEHAPRNSSRGGLAEQAIPSAVADGASIAPRGEIGVGSAHRTPAKSPTTSGPISGDAFPQRTTSASQRTSAHEARFNAVRPMKKGRRERAESRRGTTRSLGFDEEIDFWNSQLGIPRRMLQDDLVCIDNLVGDYDKPNCSAVHWRQKPIFLAAAEAELLTPTVASWLIAIGVESIEEMTFVEVDQAEGIFLEHLSEVLIFKRYCCDWFSGGGDGLASAVDLLVASASGSASSCTPRPVARAKPIPKKRSKVHVCVDASVPTAQHDKKPPQK